MWISPSVDLCGTLRTAALLLAFVLPFATCGCANPGPPKPPSLHLPAPAKDLRADRIGKEVRLSWTTSTETTDGVAVKPPLSAEICRDPVPLPPGTPPCTVVGHLAVTSGPSTAVDPLPSALLLDPVHLLRYRVRLLNATGHAADPSNVAFAAAGTAPDPVSGLHAASSPAGTRILWSPADADAPAAAILLARATVTSQTPAMSSSQPATNAAGPRAHHPAAAPPVHLQAASKGPDPGGTLDPSSQRDTTYTYIAWRSRSVILSGKSLTLRSADSPALTITVRDRIPPATPVGLEAVVDGAAVDLSWEPDADPDLAGYWVERTLASSNPNSAATQTWQRLNPALLPAPSFRDTPPPRQAEYLYRVLAADTTGNLSPPSAPATVRLSATPAP